MNCYLCLVETADVLRPACGICQHCGAGICERHLVMVQLPFGMAGGGKRTLVCSACSCPREPLHMQRRDSSQRLQEEHKHAAHWTWFQRKKHPSVLPEPAHVIAAVEQFLKQQRERP